MSDSLCMHSCCMPLSFARPESLNIFEIISRSRISVSTVHNVEKLKWLFIYWCFLFSLLWLYFFFCLESAHIRSAMHLDWLQALKVIFLYSFFFSSLCCFLFRDASCNFTKFWQNRRWSLSNNVQCVWNETTWPGYDIVVREKSISRQKKPRSQMSWKTPGKVRARTYNVFVKLIFGVENLALKWPNFYACQMFVKMEFIESE